MSSAFSRVILNGRFSCGKSVSFHVAERHGIACTIDTASIRCGRFKRFIFDQLKFILKAHSLETLPALKSLKMQLGTLKVLKEDMKCADTDVDALMNLIEKKYPNFIKLPIKEIFQEIRDANS